jgi:hypothetical protein
MKNELKTYRVTFYRKGRVELAIVEVRAFAAPLAHSPAVRYLESHLPQTAAIVKAEAVAFLVENVD